MAVAKCIDIKSIQIIRSVFGNEMPYQIHNGQLQCLLMKDNVKLVCASLLAFLV